jgi:hypothetical protein
VRFDPAPASNWRYLPSTPEKIASFGLPRHVRSARLNFFSSADEQPLHQTHRAPDQRAHPAGHGYRTQNDPCNLHGGCASAASVFLCDLGHTLTLLVGALIIGRHTNGAGSTEHMQLSPISIGSGTECKPSPVSIKRRHYLRPRTPPSKEAELPGGLSGCTSLLFH